METSVLTTASQIWNKQHIYHASHSRAKVKSLKIQLRTPKKDRTDATYLLDIKKIVDTLAAIELKPFFLASRRLRKFCYFHPHTP